MNGNVFRKNPNPYLVLEELPYFESSVAWVCEGGLLHAKCELASFDLCVMKI